MNAQDIETSIRDAAAKPRLFDVYVLGPLLIFAAFKARAPLGKWTRRALFTAGVYGVLRNVDAYQKLLTPDPKAVE